MWEEREWTSNPESLAYIVSVRTASLTPVLTCFFVFIPSSLESGIACVQTPPPFCTQAKSGRDNGEMKPIQEHTCAWKKKQYEKETVWIASWLAGVPVCSQDLHGVWDRAGWKELSSDYSATLNAPFKVAPGDPQSSKLHNKCKNILCSFRTSNKAISNNYLCMILLKPLKLIQNLYRNYKTGVLQSFYSMTQSTTGLWTEAHFLTLWDNWSSWLTLIQGGQVF